MNQVHGSSLLRLHFRPAFTVGFLDRLLDRHRQLSPPWGLFLLAGFLAGALLCRGLLYVCFPGGLLCFVLSASRAGDSHFRWHSGLLSLPRSHFLREAPGPVRLLFPPPCSADALSRMILLTNACRASPPRCSSIQSAILVLTRRWMDTSAGRPGVSAGLPIKGP